MNTELQQLKCANCDSPLSVLDRLCPSCERRNPHYLPPLPRIVAPAAPIVTLEESPPRPAAHHFDTLLKELKGAAESGNRVIVNIGLSGAGKTWLIARLRTLRGGLYHAKQHSLGQPPKSILQCNDQFLGRTHKHECNVWHLEVNDRTRNSRSGDWLVIDIAGELISQLDFIEELTGDSLFVDVLLMALAHAAALVVVVDGREIANARRLLATDPQSGLRMMNRIDETNHIIINELVRLTRYIHQWRQRNGTPCELSQLSALRNAIREDPDLKAKGVRTPNRLPTLLLVSKADTLVQLHEVSDAEFKAPGPDPTRFAQVCLPRTHKTAFENFAICRWGFVAPFVGQPPPKEVQADSADGNPSQQTRDVSEQIDFSRASYGITDMLRWLDSELAPRWYGDHLCAIDAVHRVKRWRAHRLKWNFNAWPWRRA